MADLRVDIASEFTGKKAFDQADKSTTTLTKSVIKLARVFGPAVLGAAVVKFGKDAAQAFIEDQKQATRLANTVKNLGLEFSNPAIANYIDKLTLASGVADSKLRPAFQSLLATTGDITKSQELLALAIDTSAGSTVDLETVARDLASAYVGKTKSLGKYNLGLTQAELKTAKFATVQEKLNNLYSGANAAYLTTYAGKMQALSNAAGEASEKIGGALIDSVMSLSGAQDIQQLIGQIDTLADKTAGWIDQFTLGILEINAITKAAGFLGPLGLIINRDQLSRDIQAAQVDAYNKMLRRNRNNALEGVVTPAQAAAEKKAAAAAAKRAKDLAAAQDKQTKELKKQAALKKAGSIFDLEQIQIIAALKGKVSDEDRKRLELQFALLVGNETEAKRLTYELAKAQGLTNEVAKNLASLPDAKNPFASWGAYLDDILAKARAAAGMGVSGGVGPFFGQSGAETTARTAPPTNVVPIASVPTTMKAINPAYTPATGYSGAEATRNAIVVQIDGKAVASALQDSSLSGIGSSVNRLNR
jgi:hypothetical protein